MEELWDLVKRIPSGRVAAYGALGRALDRPISGYLVGRMMARCPSDVPWWRVVTRDGRLAVHKRDPLIAEDQRRRLLSEKTEMADEDTVSPSAFIDPDLLAIDQSRSQS
jgi:alkylated DNA nucleotide flippase Atl1